MVTTLKVVKIVFCATLPFFSDPTTKLMIYSAYIDYNWQILNLAITESKPLPKFSQQDTANHTKFLRNSLLLISTVRSRGTSIII